MSESHDHHHHDHHDHGHHHGHHHAPADFGRAFAIGVVINSLFVVTEFVLGWLADSLALLADAGHNLFDVLGLVLAWIASHLGKRPPSGRFTYGLRGSSTLAALANALLLVLAAGAIAWEAIGRFQHPHSVSTTMMAVVAAVGILVNGVTAMLFWRGRNQDLNVRGAYLHMLADAAVSLGVVVAGVAIAITGWVWLDPAVSLVVVAVILAGTWGLLRDSVRLALAGVPPSIDIDRVRAMLSGRVGVQEVHDLHIWAMGTAGKGDIALTAHLIIPAGHPGDAFLAATCQALEHDFGIHHATLQVETGALDCKLAPEHVV
jgi:cobalt-zinc-cadmium efflux system protein